jgi:hypothetical protein
MLFVVLREKAYLKTRTVHGYGVIENLTAWMLRRIRGDRIKVACGLSIAIFLRARIPSH